MSRSVSAPSSVTKTSPCWKGFIVPGSTSGRGRTSHGHREATCAKKLTEGRGRQALTERRCNAAGHENLAGYLVVRGRVQSVYFFHSPRNLSLPFSCLLSKQRVMPREDSLRRLSLPIYPYHHCKRSWGFIIPAAPCRSRCRSIHRVSHILWLHAPLLVTGTGCTGNFPRHARALLPL